MQGLGENQEMMTGESPRAAVEGMTKNSTQEQQAGNFAFLNEDPKRSS